MITLNSKYRQCNQDDDLWQTFNFFYAAIMYHIFHIWKTRNKTIQDSGYVLQGKDNMLVKYFVQQLRKFVGNNSYQWSNMNCNFLVNFFLLRDFIWHTFMNTHKIDDFDMTFGKQEINDSTFACHITTSAVFYHKWNLC